MVIFCLQLLFDFQTQEERWRTLITNFSFNKCYKGKGHLSFRFQFWDNVLRRCKTELLLRQAFCFVETRDWHKPAHKQKFMINFGGFMFVAGQLAHTFHELSSSS